MATAALACPPRSSRTAAPAIPLSLSLWTLLLMMVTELDVNGDLDGDSRSAWDVRGTCMKLSGVCDTGCSLVNAMAVALCGGCGG